MKKDILHCLKVGGILCAIGSISALLIAATNMLTSNAITKHEKEKEEKALKEVFIDNNGVVPNDLVIGDKTELKSLDKKYQKLLCYWNPKSSDEGENIDNKYGYVFKTEGSDKNNYGTITMLVVINNDYSFGRISIIKNSESYATTVQKDYVDQYNAGHRLLTDVTCGATYGATVIKEMAESASSYVKEVLNNGK